MQSGDNYPAAQHVTRDDQMNKHPVRASAVPATLPHPQTWHGVPALPGPPALPPVPALPGPPALPPAPALPQPPPAVSATQQVQAAAWQARAKQAGQDRMFCADQFRAIQAKLGKQFTLDACCNDRGDNRLVAQYCSPSRSFIDHTLTQNDLVWLNAPFNSLKHFINHYRQQKALLPGLSACIVTPDWIGDNSTLVQGMTKLATFSKGTRLFYQAHRTGSRQLMPGIPWPVTVWYDPPKQGTAANQLSY